MSSQTFRILNYQSQPWLAATFPARTGWFDSKPNVRSAGLGEQRPGDGAPLLIERCGRRVLARMAVPVAGVAGVALLAMQVGVDPGGLAAVFMRDRLVGALPVALAVPPQCSQRRA